MKIIIFTILILYGSISASLAQKKMEKPFSVAFIMGNKNDKGMNWTSIDYFIDSYNVGAAKSLISPVPNLQPGNSFTWGIEGQALTFHLGFRHTKTQANAIARFKNGEYREFMVDFKQTEPYLGLLFPIKRFADVGVTIGGNMSNGAFCSGYVYKNGYKSYAADKALNGIYSTPNIANIIMGPRIDVGYMWVKLSFRADYQFRTGKDDMGDRLSTYKDIINRNIQGGTTFTDGATHQYLPQNYDDQTNVYAYSVGLNQCIYGDYTGWNFTLSLRLAPLCIYNK